jgi:hypothetical protein
LCFGPEGRTVSHPLGTLAPDEPLPIGDSERCRLESHVPNPSESDLPDPCSIVIECPICKAGPMTYARRVEGVAICVCMECETTLSVPDDALRRAIEGT